MADFKGLKLRSLSRFAALFLSAQGNKTLVIKDADYNAMKKTTASVEADWIKLAAEVHAIGAKYLGK